MSGGLVAELTLRLQNEMSAGLDEIRSEFGTLDGTLQQLNAVLSEVAAALADMKPPAALTQGMQGVITEADDVQTAVGKIGTALDALQTPAGLLTDLQTVDNELKDAVAQATALQAALGEDAAAIGAVQAGPGYRSGADTFLPPQPAFIPPGYQQGDDEEEDEGGDDNPLLPKRKTKEGKSVEAPFSDWIIDLIALASGYEGEKEYAEFQETALQTAIIEGYHGKDAAAEAQKIMRESYNQAYLSRGNVDQIEEAYFNLIRQQLPKELVDQVMGPLTEAATTYNTPVDELTQPVFNLADQFKIPGDEMAQGLAILGAASHMGHYYFADFGQGLPQVATQFERLGDTGLEGEATAAAALEMVRKGTSDSGTAATDLSYLMTYLTSGIAARFFDRTKRSQDLLGAPVMDLFDKYHIEPLNLPEYLDDERDKGIDPLNAMVDYMHTIGVGKMTPTDQAFVFNSLFHSVEASTAMQALVGHYDQFNQDQASLMRIQPGFLDQNFQTAIQGDSGGLSQLDLLGTYLYRLYGQNTWGLFGDTSGAPSQATANSAYPGSSAFNIPITLNVNVDKSGNVTANAAPGVAPGTVFAPGTSLKVNQGSVLNVP